MRIENSAQLCEICGSNAYIPIDFTSFLFRTSSSLPEVNEYCNHICAGCGVITPYPPPDIQKLVAHYQGEYRASRYAVKAGDRSIEPPISIPWSGVSFQRFQSFLNAVNDVADTWPDAVPTTKDTIIDYGAYQGLFLYAAGKVWGSQGIAYDFSRTGIEFARDALGLKQSQVAQDIYVDTFQERARFVTLVHSFEHLDKPLKFMAHLRDNILTEDGWVYLEVPNAFG